MSRINIAFGFFFLALSAALGPYMLLKLHPTANQAQEGRVAATGRLAEVAGANYDDPETLAPITADKLGRLVTDAVLAINREINARAPIDAVRSGPHVHGNLEALLNIAVGVVMLFVSCKRPWMKQVIGWLFILGTLLHSGMLYLAIVFNQSWAGQILGTGIGPLMILAGMVLAGLAVALGWRGQVTGDN
jgi:uncharacterized membrane protein YgdD (TMEM256/DUF423 family)